MTELHFPGIVLAEHIGSGAFSNVYRARHLSLDIDVAIKVFNLEVTQAGSAESLLQEARLMARLDHPNLLRIFNAGIQGASVYLMLEFMDGGTCQALKNLQKIDAATILRQLLSAVQALHKTRMLHRDIKPANCLRRLSDSCVKLADLGLAVDVLDKDPCDSLAGTAPFMAPELFESPPRYSVQSDLYAVGMTMLCMLLEKLPYPKCDMSTLINWARTGNRPRLSDVRRDLPIEISGLVDAMTDPNAANRPSSAMAALHNVLALSQVDSIPTVAISKNPSVAETVVLHETQIDLGATTIGPWVLGAEVYLSRNWSGRLVNHIATGKLARLMTLLPSGPMSGSQNLILNCAAVASKLHHAGLVEVLDWGTFNECAFVVTEDHGRPLDEIFGDGQIEEIEALTCIKAIANALEFIHSKGYVYQHIDPGAVVFGPDARSALLRWPVYCVPAGCPTVDESGRGMQVLSRAFAAPEVTDHSAKTIDTTVDVFGLGASFACMLAGRQKYLAARKVGCVIPDIRSANSMITARTVELVKAMTRAVPGDRPTALEVYQESSAILSTLTPNR